MTDTVHVTGVDLGDFELIEALCIALRSVGVFNDQLPDGKDVRDAITRTKALDIEARRRGLAYSRRLETLSGECRWNMVQLLADCSAFPEVNPYLESTPPPNCGECGVRIAFTASLSLCPTCVVSGIAAIAQGKPSHLSQCSVCARPGPGFLVYADGTAWMHYCESCLIEARRRFAET